jgi:hypothetical protein
MPQHENITGLYYFEDENLDIFLLCDFKQTTDTWGENLPDEYYLVCILIILAKRI